MEIASESPATSRRKAAAIPGKSVLSSFGTTACTVTDRVSGLRKGVYHADGCRKPARALTRYPANALAGCEVRDIVLRQTEDQVQGVNLGDPDHGIAGLQIGAQADLAQSQTAGEGRADSHFT